MKPIQRDGGNKRFSLNLGCRQKSLKRARSRVKRFAVSQGFAGEAEDIALAVQEALKNIIQHARPPDNNMHIGCAVTDNRMVIEVSDNGRGFDVGKLEHEPSSPLALHGRGIKLMKGLMDEFSITSGREGTTVHMEKKRGR